MNDIIRILQEKGVQLATGLLVLIAGLIAVRLVTKWASRRLDKNPKIRMEPTLKSFLQNLIRILLYLIVILTAVNIMGIPMTSVVALVASAGVAVSLAMQGALSNLVGGVLLVILKPIAVGEYVKIGDLEGTVQGIGAFYTDILTFDGKHISMPNSNLTNTPITNFTREGRRRVEVTFSAGYESDMATVFRVLNELVARTPDILPDPAPAVHLKEYAASSMDYVVRVWAKNEVYWDVYFALLENGKAALDAAGISIPYPQLDVHMKS